MAERAWTTRDGSPEDAAAILDLRRAVFGDVDAERLRPDVWRWQFVDNPAGLGYLRLADHGGAVVGQYAAIPTRFRLAGGQGAAERILAMSCDTMTHPAYQKQGMFVTLARELYAGLAERHGVTTVWGFPNEASHPGFVGRLEWFDIHVFPTLVKPLRSREVLLRYLRSHRLASVLGAVADRGYRLVAPRAREPRRATIREVADFDERFDTLWRTHQDLARIVQVRDANYLRWRYLGAPTFGYRVFAVELEGSLRGYFVLRSVVLFDLPFVALVDVFPCPVVDDEVTREILGFAQLFAEREEAAFLTALLAPAAASHLRRFGFLPVPGFLNLRRWYFGARCAPDDEPLLRDIDNWYVTYGDSDIV